MERTNHQLLTPQSLGSGPPRPTKLLFFRESSLETFLSSICSQDYSSNASCLLELLILTHAKYYSKEKRSDFPDGYRETWIFRYTVASHTSSFPISKGELFMPHCRYTVPAAFEGDMTSIPRIRARQLLTSCDSSSEDLKPSFGLQGHLGHIYTITTRRDIHIHV